MRPLTILLTGCDGQVGYELCRSLAPLGHVHALNRAHLDLSDPFQIRDTVLRLAPDLIVNPAAYTAVDRAENEPEVAHAINATAPKVLAESALEVGAGLIHYSTDYVFNGQNTRPWSEDDAIDPLSVYGASKAAGEAAIVASGVPHLILRTSWVYGVHGNNFMHTVLRLAKEREELRIVGDQIGSPTSSRMLAAMTGALVAWHQSRTSAEARLSEVLEVSGGIYHATAHGQTSWHGFASAILERALTKNPEGFKLKLDNLHEIKTEDYPLPAVRPKWSVLDCSRLEQAFGIRLPHWKETLEAVMEDL